MLRNIQSSGLGLRGIGVFNPLSITSSTPFLWCEVDRGTIFSGDALSAGTTPPVVTITGTNSVAFPTVKVRIAVGGARGTATYETSHDNITWAAPTATVASVNVGPFTINFPTGTYNINNTYDANPQTLNDMTTQANHMTANSLTGPLITPNSLGGRAGFTGAASRYFQRSVLTNARVVSGPMTIIVMGVSDVTPAAAILAGGIDFMRDLRCDGSGNIALVASVSAALSPTAALSASKAFMTSGSWNGASSGGHLRQQGVPTVNGTCNPSDPAPILLSSMGFGANGQGTWACVGYQMCSVFACDGLISDTDLKYLLDGFAYRYSITS